MPAQAKDGFREALRKIASDAAYRQKAIADPKSILNDFELTKRDVDALRQAAILSGADVTEIDKLMSRPDVANYDGDHPMFMNNGCCCCCCCCGETGVEILTEVV